MSLIFSYVKYSEASFPMTGQYTALLLITSVIWVLLWFGYRQNKINDEVTNILNKNSVYFEELGVITDKDMIINDKTKVTIDELKSYNTNWLEGYMSS